MTLELVVSLDALMRVSILKGFQLSITTNVWTLCKNKYLNHMHSSHSQSKDLLLHHMHLHVLICLYCHSQGSHKGKHILCSEAS
jgi:hypothetical protein